jgi:hypothetical protein
MIGLPHSVPVLEPITAAGEFLENPALDRLAGMGMSDSFYDRARTLAVVLLRIESAILVGLIVYLAILDALRTKPLSAPLALAGDFIALTLGAIGLFLCSLSFAHKKSWGRAPALLANLIALGVAYYMASGKFFIGAIPLGLLAFIASFAIAFGYREYD